MPTLYNARTVAVTVAMGEQVLFEKGAFPANFLQRREFFAVPTGALAVSNVLSTVIAVSFGLSRAEFSNKAKPPELFLSTDMVPGLADKRYARLHLTDSEPLQDFEQQASERSACSAHCLAQELGRHSLFLHCELLVPVVHPGLDFCLSELSGLSLQVKGVDAQRCNDQRLPAVQMVVLSSCIADRCFDSQSALEDGSGAEVARSDAGGTDFHSEHIFYMDQ